MTDRDVLFYLYGLGAGQESGHLAGYAVGYLAGWRLANRAREETNLALEELALARGEAALAEENYLLRGEGLEQGFGMATQILLREHDKAATELITRERVRAFGWGEILLGSFAVACFSFAALVIRDHLF